MPMYQYKGLGPTGKSLGGLREAESPKALRQLLRKDGVVVTDCEISNKGGAKARAAAAAGAPAKKGLSREVDLGNIFRGVSRAEIAVFTRQMATLLKAQITLAESLAALYDQATNVRFKVAIGEVKTAVNEGSSLADALAKHPRIFDELYVSMVRAGEVAGNLDEVMSRLADFMENALRLRSKITGAMIYPLIMILVGTGIMIVLMTAVIPEITRMFDQQGRSLPLNTRILITSANFFRHFWWAILLGMAALAYVFYYWSHTPNGRREWHSFLLALPIIGDLNRFLNAARFARTLGTMLSSGVEMLRAIEISKQILTNVVLRKAVEDAKKAVTEGESLANTLKRSGQFPSTMIHMIAVGERAGQLEHMLQRIADAYESDVDMKLTRMTSLLEPLMLVLMGGGVGFVVFSILQPIMDMGSFASPH